MRKIETEIPIQETGGTQKMGKKKERIFTNEEVALVRRLVAAGVRILRNKEISVHHPEFQDYKRNAIKEVFAANGIISQEAQDKIWPSLATRIELVMTIPPEEHFQKKRMQELKASLGQPEDGRIQELLKIALENISLTSKKKANAATIRDAVYQAISQIRYPSTKSKEAEAKVLKYYLCLEYGVPTSDPSLKSLSDPSRQKNLFAA